MLPDGIQEPLHKPGDPEDMKRGFFLMVVKLGLRLHEKKILKDRIS
jgi:hypothetical protein